MVKENVGLMIKSKFQYKGFFIMNFKTKIYVYFFYYLIFRNKYKK